MVWNKPRNVWQWLLLGVPAVLTLLASQTTQWWMPPLPIMHYTNGMLLQPSLVRDLREMSVTLSVMVPSCAIIAVILSYGARLGQRIVNTIFFFLCLLFGNGFMAGIGCAVSHASRPVEKQSLSAPMERRDDVQARQPRN